jgi:hypothetical protein
MFEARYCYLALTDGLVAGVSLATVAIMITLARLLHRATVAVQHWLTNGFSSPPGNVYNPNVGRSSLPGQRSRLAPPHSAVSVVRAFTVL